MAELKRAFALLDRVSVLQQQQKYQEAIPLAEEALAIRDRILPPNDHWIANACSWLRSMHGGPGDHKAELQYALRSLKVDEKSRPESESLANDLYNVGSAYQDLHRLAEAEPYYQRSLKIHEKISGPDNLDVASVVNNLAELVVGQILRRAANVPAHIEDQRAGVYGPDHPEVAINLNNLGLYYANLGQFSKALPLFQRPADIRDDSLGPEHPLTAHSQNALGGVNSDMGNYDKALQHYRHTLAIFEKALGQRPIPPYVG